MRLLVALLALATASCTLVDQNTFNPRAGDAPVVAAVQPPPQTPAGPPPLLVIGTAKQADYKRELGEAVSAARARKSDVVFDVVELQPADMVAGRSIGEAAEAVARAIVADGVPQDRVLLAIRPAAEASAGEVQVFVH